MSDDETTYLIEYTQIIGTGRWYWTVQKVNAYGHRKEIGAARTRFGARFRLWRIRRNLDRTVTS